MDQVILERLSNVLTKGQALISGHVTLTDFGPGIEQGPFMSWHSQSLVLLRTIFGTSHTYVESFETATKFDGIPWATPYYVEAGIGVLQAVSEDISNGWTWSFKERVHAEVFDDFLEMANSLLSDGYKDAAATIAGGVLEEHLRKLCQKNAISIEKQGGRTPNLKTLAVLNDELHKSGVCNQSEWRSVQVWIDHRNSAAHGHFTDYEQKQIQNMIEGIRDYFIRHPA